MNSSSQPIVSLTNSLIKDEEDRLIFMSIWSEKHHLQNIVSRFFHKEDDLSYINPFIFADIELSEIMTSHLTYYIDENLQCSDQSKNLAVLFIYDKALSEPQTQYWRFIFLKDKKETEIMALARLAKVVGPHIPNPTQAEQFIHDALEKNWIRFIEGIGGDAYYNNIPKSALMGKNNTSH